jgi:hypothetical protein
VPIGAAVEPFLQHREKQIDTPILVMGLCGSLNPIYTIGDIVIYKTVMASAEDSTNHWKYSSSLLEELTARLADQLPVSPVAAWASQQFINAAEAKKRLGATYGVDVVDMESKAILASFPTDQIATLRVVSDDCEHDLPDLSTAINPDGKLLPLPLIGAMLHHPIGMSRLIRGSLLGLRKLQLLTEALFS